MRKITIDAGQFAPYCGNNVRPSEMLIEKLLECLVWMDSVVLRCQGKRIPWLYDAHRMGLVKYQREPPGEELFYGIDAVLRERGGDCFADDTKLLLSKDGVVRHVPISSDEVQVGSRIWGFHDWTTIEAKAFKGTLPVDRIYTDHPLYGLDLTSNHKVYILKCLKHDEPICDCPFEDRQEARIRVRELREGMFLSAPYRAPEGITPRRDPMRGKVLAIRRSVREVPCWDIQTSDHRVYLPEDDVTVSNCDDLAAWRVAELNVRGDRWDATNRLRPMSYYPNGEPAKLFLQKFERPGRPLLYHVLVHRAPTPMHPRGFIEDPSKALGMRGSA